MLTVLPGQLVVKAASTFDGSPDVGLEIIFTITAVPPNATGASLSGNQGSATGVGIEVFTGADGFASAQLKLGNLAGQYQVTASCLGCLSATFTSTALVVPSLVISTTSLPSIGASLAYNAWLTATGGTGTGYTWCVLADSACDPSQSELPTTFTLNSAGLISALDGNSATPLSYPITVQVTDSGGGTATQSLNLTILGCVEPKDVKISLGGTLSLDGGLPEITALFVPGASTGNPAGLIIQAGHCGFTNFDWQQVIDVLLTPNLVKAENLSAAVSVGSLNAANIVSTPANPYSDGTLQAGTPSQAPAFYDPPYGGYTYQSAPAPDAAGWSRNQPNTFTAWPFYYSPLDLLSGCASFNDNHCLLPISDTYTLNFFDSPKSSCFFGGVNAFKIYCDYETPLNPAFTHFTTHLVGICGSGTSLGCTAPGMPSASLYQWTWVTNFNGVPNGGFGGITCGPPLTVYCDETSSGIPAIPGSGSGGVTVLSINGVPSPTISVVPLAGTVNFKTLVSVTATVAQFSGQMLPTGTMTLSSGAYTSAATTLDGNGAATITIPAGALPVGANVLRAAYAPSATVSASYSQAWGTAIITVNAITPQIAFTPNPNTQTYGTPIMAGSLDATAHFNSSPVSGTFAYTIGACGGDGPALIAGTSVLDAGSYSVTACFMPSQEGFAASSATAQYLITPANQSINLRSIQAQLVGATLSLNVTATSGLPVSLESLTQTVCSLTGNTATMLSVGTCTIRATQSGGLDYAAAAPAQVSFSVVRGGFTLMATPKSETVKRGQLGLFVLEVQSVNGFAGDISISCTGGPRRSVCRDFPREVRLRANCTALALSSIKFYPHDAAGVYTITFTGVSGKDTSSTTAQFTVK